MLIDKLTYSQFKQCLYFILVITTAIALIMKFPFQQNEWIMLMASALALTFTGITFINRVTQLLITAAIIFITVFMTILFSINHLEAGPIILLPFSAAMTSIAFTKKTNYVYSFFIATFFAMVMTNQTMLEDDVIGWLIACSIGLLIALIYQLIFLPQFATKQWQSLIQQATNELIQYNDQLFTCFLEGEYPDNLYLYEHRLHEKRLAYLQTIEQCQVFNKKIKNHFLSSAMEKNQQLFMNLMSCSLLRWRVSDHTIFALWRQELLPVVDEIDHLLMQQRNLIGKQLINLNVEKLSEKIDRLEDCYQHVLQVTSREPLALLLFIFHLRMLTITLSNQDSR